MQRNMLNLSSEEVHLYNFSNALYSRKIPDQIYDARLFRRVNDPGSGKYTG